MFLFFLHIRIPIINITFHYVCMSICTRIRGIYFPWKKKSLSPLPSLPPFYKIFKMMGKLCADFTFTSTPSLSKSRFKGGIWKKLSKAKCLPKKNGNKIARKINIGEKYKLHNFSFFFSPFYPFFIFFYIFLLSYIILYFTPKPYFP